MTDELTSRLSRQLHDQVDDWTHTPLTLEGVQGRARSIHRRRQAVAGSAIAAAVLAVAIPVGIGLGGSTDSSPGLTDDPTRVVDTPAPTPRADGTFPLTLDVPTGPVPATGYLVPGDQTFVTPEATVDLPGRFDQLLPLGDGWVGIRSPGRNEEGTLEVVRLDGDFAELSSVPTMSGIVATDDGTRVAWVENDGGRATVVVAAADGDGYRAEAPAEDIAVQGFLTDDRVAVSWFFRGRFVHGEARPEGVVGAPALSGMGDDPSFQDARGTSVVAGLVAGQTEFRGDSTCSAVRDATSFETLAETCDYSLGQFSPDGRWIVGYASYSDFGSPTLAILDAATLLPVVEYAADRGQPFAVVHSAVWEDDDSLVAVVEEDGRQGVVRADSEGRLTAVDDFQELRDMSILLRLPASIMMQNG